MNAILKQKVITISLFFTLAVLISNSLYSQFNNTIFWMQDLPQSVQYNVALQPSHKFYLGFPGLSSFHTSIHNTGFALNDIVSKDINNKLYIDNEKLVSAINNKNSILFDIQYEILSFGFTSNLNTFSFSTTEKIGLNFGYSADFIRLLNYGNQYFLDKDRAADFTGTGIDMIHYREFAFGYTRQFTDYLVAGIRAKLLFGLSNLWLENNHISLYTDPGSKNLIAYADLLINTSSPVGITDLDDNDFKATEYILNTSNRGLAFDFGLAYQPIEDLTIAFSLIDMGRIHWTDGVENISMKGAFTFDGININELIDDDSGIGIIDSLKQDLNYTESFNNYRSPLNGGLFFSAAYHITPKQQVSLLTGSRFYPNHTYRTLSAAYHLHASDKACFTASYSIIHGNFSNLGLGMNFSLGPLQFYLLTDNILGMMRPHTLQSVNIHFGFNVVIGHQRRNQQLKPHLQVDQIVNRIKRDRTE